MAEHAKGRGKTTGDTLERATALQRAGKPADAERLCRQILDKDPKHVDAAHLLGLARAAQGDLDGAVALLEEVLAGDPNAATAVYNLATLKQHQGQDEAALTGFLRAAALAPAYVPARLAAAAALHKKGRLEEALVHYREGLARDPDNPPAQLNLALALRALGRLDEAEAALGTMLQRHPDDPNGLLQLGDLFTQRQRWSEARSVFERCRELAPGSATALLGLVGARKGLGDLEGAIAAARAALAAEPTRPPTHRVLAILLSEAGELDEALNILSGAVQHFPDDPAILRAFAGTAARAGRPEALLEAYGRLLSRPAAAEEDWIAFADAIRLLRIDAYDQGLADLVLAALRCDGVDWQNLAVPAISLIKAMPAAAPMTALADGEIEGGADASAIGLTPLTGLFEDPLFLALLSRAIIADRDLELALTAARRALLSHLLHDPKADMPERLVFALAEQCFLDEYAFAESAAEAGQINDLMAALAMPDHPLAARPAAWALLACYRLLADCGDLSTRLAEMEVTARGPLATLFTRQYRGPLDERAGRDTIPTLTAIGDEVSQAVRAQYEESPYDPAGTPHPGGRLRHRAPCADDGAALCRQQRSGHRPQPRQPRLCRGGARGRGYRQSALRPSRHSRVGRWPRRLRSDRKLGRAPPSARAARGLARLDPAPGPGRCHEGRSLQPGGAAACGRGARAAGGAGFRWEPGLDPPGPAPRSGPCE
jgi:tetratricopeptide (TPR) repeat protein